MFDDQGKLKKKPQSHSQQDEERDGGINVVFQ